MKNQKNFNIPVWWVLTQLVCGIFYWTGYIGPFYAILPSLILLGMWAFILFYLVVAVIWVAIKKAIEYGEF